MKTDIKMKLRKRKVPLGADSRVSFMVSRLCASDWINGFANFSICQSTH